MHKSSNLFAIVGYTLFYKKLVNKKVVLGCSKVKKVQSGFLRPKKVDKMIHI